MIYSFSIVSSSVFVCSIWQWG